jgi:hypothetical protein
MNNKTMVIGTIYVTQLETAKELVLSPSAEFNALGLDDKLKLTKEIKELIKAMKVKLEKDRDNDL